MLKLPTPKMVELARRASLNSLQVAICATENDWPCVLELQRRQADLHTQIAEEIESHLLKAQQGASS